MRRPILLAFFLALLAGACRREAPPSEPAADAGLPAVPASPTVPFAPEGPGRRIRLTLLPAAKMIRKGEPFRFRLELRNVGTEPVEITEKFFEKPPSRSKIEFHCSGPGRTESYVSPGMNGPFFSREISKAEYDKGMREQQRRLDNPFQVTLKPGETLLPRSPGGWAELDYETWYAEPGTYRFKAVFEDPPPDPLTEEEIREGLSVGIDRVSMVGTRESRRKKALGRVESNGVEVEVLR